MREYLRSLYIMLLGIILIAIIIGPIFLAATFINNNFLYLYIATFLTCPIIYSELDKNI